MIKLFIPTIAHSIDDMRSSHKLFSILGQDINGLMIVAKGGMTNFTGEGLERQYANFVSLPGHENISIMVMVPNMPLGDIDFYHDPQTSIANLKKIIDFTVGIPTAVSPRIVTFHLNSLLKSEEWEGAGYNSQERYQKFSGVFSDKILPALMEIVSYARSRNVELKVETTPVPELGDIADNPELSRLGNPFPLYSGRGFAEIRQAGLGIALDLCHTFTLYKAAKLFKEKGDRLFDIYKGLFPSDIEYLSQHSLIDEVQALESGDVVHLNDSLGLYDPENNLVHEEGVALGDGEIQELPEIIKILQKGNFNLVFEINESNYINRPNLIKSVEYFKLLAG